MRIACSTSRAQSRPRNAHVPRPTVGMRKPFASITFIAIRGPSFSFSDVIGKAKQVQCPAPSLAAHTRRNHRVRHGSLEIVVEECTGLVARCNPGALHLAQLENLLGFKRVAQAAEALIEDV